MPEPAPITPTTRVCLVPDLADELTVALDQLEELLRHIAGWIEDDPTETVPPPIGDGTALAALRRVGGAVRPIQGITDGPRLFAPDGRLCGGLSV